MAILKAQTGKKLDYTGLGVGFQNTPKDINTQTITQAPTTGERIHNAISDVGTGVATWGTSFRRPTSSELQQGRGTWKDRAGLLAGSATKGLANELVGGAASQLPKVSGLVKRLLPVKFTPNPEMMYRGLGRSGLDAAFKTRMVGTANKTGNYGEDLFVTNHFNLAKGLYSRDQVTYEGDPFGVVGSSWKKILPKDSKSYIAEIPKSELTSLTELDPMIFKNRGAIPTTNVRFLKENWLRGYKEIKAK